MKHTIMNNVKNLFGASLVLFLLASCNNTAANNGSKNQVTVKGKISIQGYEGVLPSQLFAGLNKKSGARNITTQFTRTKEDFDGTFYYLLQASGEDTQNPSADPIKHTTEISIDEDEFSVVLENTVETWNLQLQLMYKQPPKYTGGSATIIHVMSSRSYSYTLTELFEDSPISFDLYPAISSEDSSNIGGNLCLTIEDATEINGEKCCLSYVTIQNNLKNEGLGTTQNNFGLEDFEEPYKIEKGAADFFDINIQNVAPGNYNLTFKFYTDGNFVPVYSFTETVSIYPTFVTDTILSRSGEHVSFANDEETGEGVYSIKITNDLVTNYITKEQHVSETNLMFYQTYKEDEYSSPKTEYYYQDKDDDTIVPYENVIDYTFDSNGYVYMLHSDGKTITSDNPACPSMTIVPTATTNSTFTTAIGIEIDTATDTLYAYNNVQVEGYYNFIAVYSPVELFADEYYFTVEAQLSGYRAENIAVYDGTIYALLYETGYPYGYKVVAIDSTDGSGATSTIIKKASNDEDVEDEENVLMVFGLAMVDSYGYLVTDNPRPKITDMIYMEGALYFLVNQYGIYTGGNYMSSGSGYKPGIFSRGALVRVSDLLAEYPEIDILGWTDNKADSEPTELTFEEGGTNKYRVCLTSGNRFYEQNDPDIEITGGSGNNLISAKLYFTEGEIYQGLQNLNIESINSTIYSPQTIDSYFAGALFYGSSSGFYGPQKFVALKPKKLVIADDGLAFYVDADNIWSYKNVNRVVTVDLKEFAIEEASEVDYDFTQYKDGEITLFGDASSYAYFPFGYSKYDQSEQKSIYLLDFPEGYYDASGYSLNTNTEFYLTLQNGDDNQD